DLARHRLYLALLLALRAGREPGDTDPVVVVRPPRSRHFVRGADSPSLLHAPREYQAPAGGDRGPDWAEGLSIRLRVRRQDAAYVFGCPARPVCERVWRQRLPSVGESDHWRRLALVDEGVHARRLALVRESLPRRLAVSAGWPGLIANPGTAEAAATPLSGPWPPSSRERSAAGSPQA